MFFSVDKIKITYGTAEDSIGSLPFVGTWGEPVGDSFKIQGFEN